jgi:hypothetical protein
MRARMLFAAGLVAALARACSNPPADTGLDIDADLASKLELALSRAAATEEPIPVASAIEAPRPPEAEPRPEPVRRRPAAVATRPQREAEVRVVANSEPQVAQAPDETEEPTFTVSPWPRTTTDVVAADATIARDGSGSPGGGDARDDCAKHGRRTRRGGGPGILIRGGGWERDPGAIHMPARGGITIGIGGIVIGGGHGAGDRPDRAGALINERAPRNPVFTAGATRTSESGSRPVFRRGSVR